MVTATYTPRVLRQLWRRQLMSRLDSHVLDARRDFVAMTFINLANTTSAFVDIENLLMVLLYEDCACSESRLGRSPLRLTGYRVSRVPHGVQWGGERNSAFLKNLLLAPKRKAFGQRMDSRKAELLELALKLDRRLSRAARHSVAPWRLLRLPQLWAGFRQRHTLYLRFAGPEFEEACREASASAASLVEAAAQTVDGLVLYPMDWVSNQLGTAKAVFAEITPTMQRRIFRVAEIPGSLIGFQGASSYDFFNSRYRRQLGRSPKQMFAKEYRKCRPTRMNAAYSSPVSGEAVVASV